MAQMLGRGRGWLLLLIGVLLGLGAAILLEEHVVPLRTASKAKPVQPPDWDGPGKLRVVRSERMGNYLLVTFENQTRSLICFGRSELFASRNLEDFRIRKGENLTPTTEISFPEQLINGIDASAGILVAEVGTTKLLYELDEPAVLADGVVVQPSFLMLPCEDLFSSGLNEPVRVAQAEPSAFPPD